MSRKTILYLITQSELGGAQRYCLDLAKNLKKEFKVIIAFGQEDKKADLAWKLQTAGIKFYTVKNLKRAISPINDFLALIQIIKLIKITKPDIIHLNSSKVSILGSLAKLCVMRYALCVYTAHGWVFNEPLSFIKKFFYKYAEKFSALFKDKIICVSECDRQLALKEKIAPAKKLITIRNGLEPVNFLSRQEAREKLQKIIPSPLEGLPAELEGEGQGEVIIGSIANLYPTKGLKYLVEATKQLLTFNSQLLTIIIGDGPEKKNLKKLIKNYNLQKNFILAGSIDKAAQLLPAFDIYVCSSVKEGLSYTLIEAMQAGLPIVATAVGGNPELIVDQKTGLLARPADPQDLAEKIKALTESYGLQQGLSAQARHKALKEFGLEQMLEKTKEVYRA